jgi:hypothetical protein
MLILFPLCGHDGRTHRQAADEFKNTKRNTITHSKVRKLLKNVNKQATVVKLCLGHPLS